MQGAGEISQLAYTRYVSKKFFLQRRNWDESGFLEVPLTFAFNLKT